MNTALRSTRPDIYTRITNTIIEQLEKGKLECRMLWHSQGFGGMPRNPATKKPYRGVNTLVLWASREEAGYASSHWASYLQWKSLGAQVRKDERGTCIVFYKRQEESDSDGTEEEQPRAVLRHSFVFNADQVDGWKSDEPYRDVDHRTFVEAEEFLNSLGGDVRYGSDNAYYQPATDRIFMPSSADFYDMPDRSGLENFFAVHLHEYIHWTGHASRLKRDLSGKFRSEAYAMEELVAELGSAVLCCTLGISTFPRPDHAAYIQSWLKVLKEQKTAIFTAASAASAAAQFLEALAAENMQPEEAVQFNPAV